MKKITLLVACYIFLSISFLYAADDDGDGIDSAVETTIGTDPLDADTDNDLLSDGQEDLDQDGIVDSGESNPRDADTDDDGLSDGEESGYALNKLNPDFDGDGLSDGLEMGRTTRIPGGTSNSSITYLGTNISWIPDSETGSKTDPMDSDCDNDGIIDGNEDKNLNGFREVPETSPVDIDSDDDGLGDNQEDIDLDGIVDAVETDPNDNDTDNDALNDGLETGRIAYIAGGRSDGAYVWNRVDYLGTDPGWIPDAQNSTTTDPLNPDTDGDTIQDGEEVIAGNALGCAAIANCGVIPKNSKKFDMYRLFS